MTIVNLKYNAGQICRINSTDTIVQVCLTICNGIVDYLAYTTLIRDPVRRKQVETACTMIQWYMGILARACPVDRDYDGLPIIQLMYIEKLEANQDYPSRYAVSLRDLEGVPPSVLTEALHRIVTTTAGCVACRVITVSQRKIEEWITNVVGLLNDIHRAIDPDPDRSRDGLDHIIVKYLVHNNNRIIHDYV
jgi:hypothetical protein